MGRVTGIIKKGNEYLKNYGVKGFAKQIKIKAFGSSLGYDKWFRNHELKHATLKAQGEEAKSLGFKKVCAVVIADRKTDNATIDKIIKSLREQSYPTSQIIVCND